MSKQIEILTITDPVNIKLQLEQMVNAGWDIKGVVSYGTIDPQKEPFVILERDSADDPTVSEELYENEEPAFSYYSRPEPPRKDISISMGS